MFLSQQAIPALSAVSRLTYFAEYHQTHVWCLSWSSCLKWTGTGWFSVLRSADLALNFRDDLMFATAFAFNLASLNTWSLLDTSFPVFIWTIWQLLWMAAICIANAAPLFTAWCISQTNSLRDGGSNCSVRLQPNGRLWYVSSNNWIVPEVPIGCFKSSFRSSQWKSTHRKHRRRRRFCRCNQSERGPCHCRESAQPQELWSNSSIPGMISTLQVSFLLSMILFVFSFYPFLPLITTVMRNCVLVSSSPKGCLIFLLSYPTLLS